MNATDKFQAKQYLHGDGYLAPFISIRQRIMLMDLIDGEEGDYFVELVCNLKRHIESMPKTGETDGQGTAAVVQLHYFAGGFDAWVTEKDMGNPDLPKGEDEGQHQAFGAARFHGNDAELGYISIAELIENSVELDLHWTPKPIKEVMK